MTPEPLALRYGWQARMNRVTASGPIFQPRSKALSVTSSSVP